MNPNLDLDSESPDPDPANSKKSDPYIYRSWFGSATLNSKKCCIFSTKL
jgi:hypothetical protein